MAAIVVGMAGVVLGLAALRQTKGADDEKIVVPKKIQEAVTKMADDGRE